MSTELAADHWPGEPGRPLVVLLPGMYVGGWVWDRQVGAVRAAGWPVLRLRDPLCALGRNAGPVAAVVAKVVATCRAYSVERMVVCGVSYGGLVALDLAAAHSDLVVGIVAGGVPGMGADLAPRLQDARSPVELAHLVAHTAFYDPGRMRREVDEIIDSLRQPAYISGFAQAVRAIRRYDVLGAVTGNRRPALYLWGEHDATTPPGALLDALPDCPTSRLVMFDRSGHLPSFEEPAAFTRELVGFLDEIAAETASRGRGPAPMSEAPR